tara:strand:+ start:754 stop:888 length:135 start_codon:yes stop_codon:yes gene_type:complete
MYREAYFRCQSTPGCGSLLPDEGTMIDAAHMDVINNRFISEEVR